MGSPAASSFSRYACRTVFISDVHLGFRGCQAEYLLDFLRHVDADRLVLVGDIVDLWSLRKTIYWPTSHHEVLKAILRLARNGTRVTYVPGNHDEGFRELCGAEVAGIDIHREFVHELADGRRYLVLHGDEFDGAVKFSGLLKDVGEWFYDVMLWLGRGAQAIRRRFGFGYWSLATWVKQGIPAARTYIERYEQAAAHAARRQGLDGVICGHIHRPKLRDVNGVRYCNTGDWVEHCSVLAEDRSGRLELLNWATIADARRTVRPLEEPAPALDTAA